jgi:hypothetical protein
MVSRAVRSMTPTASRCLVCTGDTDGGYSWPERQELRLSLNRNVLLVLVLNHRIVYYYMDSMTIRTPCFPYSYALTLGNVTFLERVYRNQSLARPCKLWVDRPLPSPAASR